jgi:putative nucleotidyltransferase with HDIG domain
LLEEIRKKIKELSALREIGKEISSSLSLEKVLNTIIDRALDLLNAQGGFIMLLDHEGKELSIAVARGLSEEAVKQIRIKPEEHISEPHYTHSSLSAPLKIKDRVIGVININGHKGKGYTPRYLEILKELADQAAIAIDNARVHEELQKVALNTIKALAVTLDQKDHYTHSHSQKVTCYAMAIAREMNLEEEIIRKIELASQVHDLGKIGIRDYILSKPGKLTAEEWEEIKTHTVKGAEILKSLEFLDGVIGLVRQHHERSDGKGYPDGLQEKDILLGARIMAVADSFDAMTSDRPYRPAMTRQEAVAEIRRGSGTIYDPAVVAAFLKALDKKVI